ncbi:MAG: SDR family NAD(P)-dependent oxidoreductase [Glaciecola sp.]|jgi:NAD(P)-dependent dehydrogenase (short-subunit alcohol dehydrogenase family)
MSTALVIGSNGGIAQAMVEALLQMDDIEYVHTVSRHSQAPVTPTVTHFVIDSQDESQVARFIQTQKEAKVHYTYVISTVGVLHSEQGLTTLKPEKRLEDVQPAALAEYFAVNTIVPMIWLKHLLPVLPKTRCVIAFLSARVGSISDNRLGGWYGYRASKAALNMCIKNTAIEYQRRNKHAILLSYHPGTVDTGLSQPFQANVPKGKLFTPAFTAQCLMRILQEVQPEQSPYYVDWQGVEIPW